VEGNVEEDQQPMKAAYKNGGWYTETPNPLTHLDYISFAHISQKLTELKWDAIKKKNI